MRHSTMRGLPTLTIYFSAAAVVLVGVTQVEASGAESLAGVFERISRDVSGSSTDLDPTSPIFGLVTENKAKINMGLVPQQQTPHNTIYRTSSEVARLWESSASASQRFAPSSSQTSAGRDSNVRSFLASNRRLDEPTRKTKHPPIVDFNDCAALLSARGRGSAQHQVSPHPPYVRHCHDSHECRKTGQKQQRRPSQRVLVTHRAHSQMVAESATEAILFFLVLVKRHVDAKTAEDEPREPAVCRSTRMARNQDCAVSRQ